MKGRKRGKKGQKGGKTISNLLPLISTFKPLNSPKNGHFSTFMLNNSQQRQVPLPAYFFQPGLP